MLIRDAEIDFARRTDIRFAGWLHSIGYHESVAGEIDRTGWTASCRTGPHVSSIAAAGSGS